MTFETAQVVFDVVIGIVAITQAVWLILFGCLVNRLARQLQRLAQALGGGPGYGGPGQEPRPGPGL